VPVGGCLNEEKNICEYKDIALECGLSQTSIKES